MSLKTFLAKYIAQWRVNQVQRQLRKPVERQQALLQKLVKKAANTSFGQEHSFAGIRSVKDFQASVPIREYEDFKPYFDRVEQGEKDVCWPGQPLYLAETSGTTAGAKKIPISKDSMPNQVKGARDALLFYMHNSGNRSFLDGKMMFLSGSPIIRQNQAGINVGRLSGIANHYVPNYLQRNRVPDIETNSIQDWETKIAAIIEQVKDVDLRLISGIPPWVQMFFERLEEKTGKQPGEIWPNLSVYVHGGVDYRPYREIFQQVLGRSVDFVEVFPASEGFFAVQNEQDDDGLLLMLDYGIFFEFVPLEEYGKPNPTRLTLDQVELEKNYALIVTTNAGLWAYSIGDTVRFTSLSPHKIRVSGRTKHFISAFGEHVIQEEVNNAMLAATQATGAQIIEFTVAPYISDSGSYHEWLVEFEKEPEDLAHFAQLLDEKMMKQNIFYEHLRSGNMLNRAQVTPLQRNASRAFMESQGKLGGQNKFPRLANHRKIADFLQAYVKPNATPTPND